MLFVVGTIPESMKTLRNLQGLYLFDNYIEGETHQNLVFTG